MQELVLDWRDLQLAEGNGSNTNQEETNEGATEAKNTSNTTEDARQRSKINKYINAGKTSNVSVQERSLLHGE